MPRSAPTPCRHPACALVLDKPGYCEQHRPVVHRDYGRARRGFDTELGFYQSARWREVRAAFLREHPLCVACKGAGLVVAAKVADHIRPLKDGGERFDWVNLQGLCVSCHNRKTARETARRSRPPRGSESLQTAAKDACACQDFCACKLKPRGDPPERKINGRKKAAPH